jgi:hypothetical protein
MAKKSATVAPGEFVSVTNLLWGFLQDLTPNYPDDLEDIPVNKQVLSALMVLAESFAPKNEEEAMELAYIKDTLKCQLDTLS